MGEINTYQEKPELTSKFVASNARVSSKSVFSDLLWDFVAETPLPSLREASKVIDFYHYINDESIDRSIVNNFILALQELCYAKLRAPLPAYKPVSVLTVKNLISAIKPFILWCMSKNLISFEDVTDEHIDGFKLFLAIEEKEGNQNYSDDRVDAILKAINNLYTYRNKITHPLHVPPYKNQPKGFSKHGRYAVSECKTPVIPDKIYKPLIRIAYNYVEIYSQSIIAMLDKRDEVIRDLSKEQLSNDSTIIRQKNYLKKFTTYLGNATISINPDTKRPWRKSWKSVQEFDKDVVMLRNAAWTIIFALSGMRLSEFYSIKSDSISETKKRLSETKRIYLKGHVFKDTKNPKKETWVVNEVVKSAVEILLRLTNDMRKYGQTDSLILTTKNSILTGRNNPQSIAAYADSIRQPAASTILKALNIFCTACHEQHSENSRMKDWEITARQYRRTLARHIAREPFGVIAGKLQYKHVEVAMFEGYAGQDNSFLEELNEERAAASIDFIQEVIDDTNSGDIYSAKSVQILNEFRGVATEKRTTEYYLKNRRMMIYPGLLNYCFFDPESALCLKESTDKKEKPLLNSCRPDHCQNSCITKSHLPIWVAQIDDAMNMLKIKDISEAQKHVLRQEIQAMKNAISPALTDKGEKKNDAAHTTTIGGTR